MAEVKNLGVSGRVRLSQSKPDANENSETVSNQRPARPLFRRSHVTKHSPGERFKKTFIVIFTLSEISRVLHSQNRNSKINPTRKIYVAFLYIINIYLHTIQSNKRKRCDQKGGGGKRYHICYICDVNTDVVGVGRRDRRCYAARPYSQILWLLLKG